MVGIGVEVVCGCEKYNKVECRNLKFSSLNINKGVKQLQLSGSCLLNSSN